MTVNNLASVYSAIEQYDPYGDNSFLVAMSLTILFTFSILYLGIMINSKEIESIFPPQPDSNIPRNSMPPPLRLMKSLLVWGNLYVFSFVVRTLFTSLFVMDRSKNKLVDRTFINSKVDLFIRIFLFQVFLLCQCISTVYFCLLFSFYWPPQRLDPPPSILCTFNNRERAALIFVFIALFAHLIILNGTLWQLYGSRPFEGGKIRLGVRQ